MGGLTTLSGFEYVAPTDLTAAATALRDAGGRACVLAGGTDILVQLREGMRSADLVIDVKKIPTPDCVWVQRRLVTRFTRRRMSSMHTLHW